MSKKPSASQNMALRAAAMVAREREAFDEAPIAAPVSEPQPADLEPPPPAENAAPRRGRPRGKRPVEARQTIYLDKARHAALARIAEDRGRSVHSLILEGIDHVIQKPIKPGWQ